MFPLPLFVVSIVGLSLGANPMVLAQEMSPDTIRTLRQLSLEGLLNQDIKLGSRSATGRSMKNSPVPLDVITQQELENTGFAELGQALQRLVPAFNFPRPSLVDGTDHVRPFTLRGLGADQVLVLVNGKRRHNTALLHVNSTVGRGSTGVDINMIPIHAIERIEILRDGAAAQYGSDAIAGIINIVLNTRDEAHLRASWGKTRHGDGRVAHLSLSGGQTLDHEGFVHFTGEIRDRGNTNRSGLDMRPQYFDGDVRNTGEGVLNHEFGDAANQDVSLMLNAEKPDGRGSRYYGNASLGYRKSEAAGFFRRPSDNRNVRAIYPDGFLPVIAPDILDAAITVGHKRSSQSAAKWDLDTSYQIGLSEFQFNVQNSLNTSLGVDSPREFDSGNLRFMQHIAAVDAFKALDVGLESKLETGLGAELRWEQFSITSGEPDSYRHGGVPILDGPNAGASASSGAQVFPGFAPSNAREESRYNASIYGDFSYQITPRWLGEAATRYEYYSDFGSTWNGKLATAYEPDEQWSLRASTSTGFRAPALAQSHYTATASAFILNENSKEQLLEVGTFAVDHPVARALGAKDLEAEKSYHFSAGFSFNPSKRWLYSLDYFYTRVDDRILLSGNVTQNVDNFGQAAVDILRQAGIGGARFFTNAVDTETQGIDATLKYEWKPKRSTKTRERFNFTALYHYSNTRLLGDVRTPAIFGDKGRDIILNRTEQVQRLESGQPQDMLILTAQYQRGRFSYLLRASHYGNYDLINYLDRPKLDQRVDSQWVLDAEVSYTWGEHMLFAVGAHNLTDAYPDESFTTEDDTISGAGKILPYAQNSPFGFNGAFYYARMEYRF